MVHLETILGFFYWTHNEDGTHIFYVTPENYFEILSTIRADLPAIVNALPIDDPYYFDQGEYRCAFSLFSKADWDEEEEHQRGLGRPPTPALTLETLRAVGIIA